MWSPSANGNGVRRTPSRGRPRAAIALVTLFRRRRARRRGARGDGAPAEVVAIDLDDAQDDGDEQRPEHDPARAEEADAREDAEEEEQRVDARRARAAHE